ncbi:hypothetical protein J6590_037443 [Homalodisca vitripennis]|nr:hypothetical protein J6590_037443 [Homalodisca vitripennis]
MRRWAMGVDESFHTTSGARRTAQTPRGAQIPAGLPYAGHAASTPDYSAKGYCIILGVSHVKTWERRTARAGRNRPRVKTFSFPGERRGGRRTACAGSCERALRTLDRVRSKITINERFLKIMPLSFPCTSLRL